MAKSTDGGGQRAEALAMLPDDWLALLELVAGIAPMDEREATDHGEFSGWGWFRRRKVTAWPAQRTDPELTRMLRKVDLAQDDDACGPGDSRSRGV